MKRSGEGKGKEGRKEKEDVREEREMGRLRENDGDVMVKNRGRKW